MSTVKMPLGQVINFISEGIEQTLASRIKEAVALQAEKIVEEVAKDLAKGIKSSLEAFEEAETGKIIVTLNITSPRDSTDYLSAIEKAVLSGHKSPPFRK